jgi:tRNA threonylcarbamoyladenosine biosynthesis protein TsaE
MRGKSMSLRDTKKIATIAIRLGQRKKRTGALVFALSGPLGSGKTSFVRAMATIYGIPSKKITSPTFVLIKKHTIRKHTLFSQFFHADAYRVATKKEFESAGFRNIFRNRDAVVCVEWAENIKHLIPKNSVWIYIAYGKEKKERNITIL